MSNTVKWPKKHRRVSVVATASLALILAGPATSFAAPSGARTEAGAAQPGGPPVFLTTVPNLVGQPASAAPGILIRFDLSVGTKSSTVLCGHEGKVVAQTPPGGILVVPGTSVDYTVARCT